MMKDKRKYFYPIEQHGRKVYRQYIGKGGPKAMAIIEAIEREKCEDAL